MLSASKKAGRAAFIPFTIAGHHSLQLTEQVVDVLVEEGADVLELGVPFSDPMADGPVIQVASERASRSVSLDDVLQLTARIHQRHPALSVVLFSYFNPIFRMGIGPFAQKAQASGVRGVLVVDLPPEESGEYRKVLASHGLQTIFLASPTTDPARIRLIDEASTGFIYYVSRTGVTGVRSELSSTLEAELASVRKLTTKPLAVGFGISTPEQARATARWADAVVVGSAFVRIVEESAADVPAMLNRVRELARALRQASGEKKT
jgi:tryptophan synthase alpha chain